MNPSTSAIENLLSKYRSQKPSLERNHRRARRYRMDVPARFRIYLPSCPEVSSAHIPAQIFDLSRMGIGLLTDTVECGGFHIMHPWPATSEQCLLEIQILYGQASLMLRGQAVWYSQQEEKKPFAFRVGIQLLDVNAEMKERIRALIDLKASRNDNAAPEAE